MRDQPRLPLLLALVLSACGTAQGQPAAAEATRATDRPGGQDVGLIRTRSAVSFEDTLAQLEAAVEARPVRMIHRVPHAEAAARAGMELRPTVLFVFGNPRAGSPLMAAAPTLALDLPQRMLVYEDAGEVWVVHNDPRYLAERHGLTGHGEVLDRIAGLLSAIAEEATRAP